MDADDSDSASGFDDGDDDEQANLDYDFARGAELENSLLRLRHQWEVKDQCRREECDQRAREEEEAARNAPPRIPGAPEAARPLPAAATRARTEPPPAGQRGVDLVGNIPDETYQVDPAWHKPEDFEQPIIADFLFHVEKSLFKIQISFIGNFLGKGLSDLNVPVCIGIRQHKGHGSAVKE